MSDQPFQPIAKRESWKTLPPPAIRTGLALTETYSNECFERIKQGLIPGKMEDKWFIFFDDPWLYFHRSWTGTCIYGLRFEPTSSGAIVVESWVNRDRAQYNWHSDEEDRDTAKILIDRLLLGRG